MVKKAILFFTVLFMIFGCEPTVYEGAEKVENPTKSRSGFFNTDVTLGNDVVSVFNQYGESVSGFVLSEEGEYTITYTDGKTEKIVIDKTPPVSNGFVNTEQMLNLAKVTEFTDNVGSNAFSDASCDENWSWDYDAYWKDGRDPFKEDGGPGDYVRVYVAYDPAGNASEPFELEITAYEFNGDPGEEVKLDLKEGEEILDGNSVKWHKELNAVTLTANVTGGTGPYTYVWTVDDEVRTETGNELMISSPKEKKYKVTVKVKDTGGMPAIKTVAVGFDKTAPVIQRGVKTLPGYTAEDRLTFQESASTLRIIENGSRVATINGQYVDTELTEIELNTPYQRTVTVTDNAGNVSEAFVYEIMFVEREDEAGLDGTVATPVPTDGFPLPSDSQVKWMQMEQYAFIHWGPNAFGEGQIGNGEWGNGYPAGADAFRPGSDADTITQGWIDAAVSAGMTGIIMVAKHHDGFCLWNTVTTQYSVCKNGDGYSYHDEDYLKALIENMRDYNSDHSESPLKLGVYVSPWDRNNWTYGGRDEDGKFPYLEYVFRTQITEVIEYVETYGGGKVILFELWLDGANTPSGWYGGQLYNAHVAEGASVLVDILPDGRADVESFKKYHQYDYASKLNFNLTHRSVTLPSDWRNRIYTVAQEVVDSYKPTADHEVMIFGSQIRWVGNEQGWAGRTNWIMPASTDGQNPYGDENGTTVKPAEADMKTQNGWFFTAGEDKGAAKMIEFWYRSVGRNGTLLLNFSPDRDGVIPSNNLTSAQTMWNTVSSDFDDNLAARAYKVSASHVRDNHISYSPYKVIDGDYETYWTVGDGRGSEEDEWIQVTFSEALSFNRIVLQENIRFGQRVKAFTVEYKNGEDDEWKTVTYPNMPTTISGDSNAPDVTTTIGYKRILRSNTVSATDVRVTFTNYRKDTRVPVVLSEFGLYLAD